MPIKTHQEKRGNSGKTQAEIEAQLRALDAKAKESDRKNDTRRKVIAGALVLEDMEKNPNDPLAARLLYLLNAYVEPRSRRPIPVPARVAGRRAKASPAGNPARAVPHGGGWRRNRRWRRLRKSPRRTIRRGR